MKWMQILFFTLGLSGCVGSIWTGATMVYDRHNVYKKWNDYSVYFKVNNAITIDNRFKNKLCVIDIAVFHGDVLLAGHVPNRDMQQELYKRVTKIRDYRHLFFQVGLSTLSNSIQDSWITTKIRSQIFADGSIDPNAFKVITSDKIVYLMGEVHQGQAEKVIHIARHTHGVMRVVKLLKYYTYQNTL